MSHDELVDIAKVVGDDWKESAYYAEAESRIQSQWDVVVWPVIQGCDFSTTLELGAGRGRNSDKLKDLSEKLIVVDINEENIAYLRQRFRDSQNVSYVRNDGVSLGDVRDNSVTFVYTFDSMVHFDSDVVRAYLREFHRIMKPGAKGFCHYSNFQGNPTGTYRDHPAWRNFMSRELFEHYATKEALVPLLSKVVKWDLTGITEDAVTLFQKPVESTPLPNLSDLSQAENVYPRQSQSDTATDREPELVVETVPNNVLVAHWRAAADQRAITIRALEEELAIVYHSKSWSLTAPLRTFRKSVRLVTRGTIDLLLCWIRRLLPPPVKTHLRKALRMKGSTPLSSPGSSVLQCLSPPAPTIINQEPLAPSQVLVSVVVPCFNYGEFLEEAVESVRRQTLPGVELIVVDDGSTDPSTQSVLESLSESGVRILRPPHRGLAAARNQGIQEATGRYICCLDADDRLSPTYLEKAVALLEVDHGLAFVYTWVRMFGDEDSVWYTEPFDLGELRLRNFISVGAVFRRADWTAVGGFAEDMRHGYEDWEFWLRMGGAGRRGSLIPEALYDHRLHGYTMVHRARERHEQLLQELRDRHPVLYADDKLVKSHAEAYRSVRTHPPFLNFEAATPRWRPRRHVLVLVPWLPAGGAEAVLHAVLSGYQRLNVEFTIVTSEPSQNEWHERFAVLTRNIYHLPTFLPADSWSDFAHMLIRTRAVGLVLLSGSTFGYELSPALKAAYPSLPIHEILHNSSTAGHIHQSSRFTQYIDRHIAVSNAISMELRRRGVPDERITVIPNGVDTDQLFVPERYERRKARHSLRLQQDHSVVAFIGRLSEEKQPIEFLRIAATVKNSRTTFLLVGDGPQRELVRAEIQRQHLEDHVVALPHVLPENIPDILAAIDLLAITSATEGLPVVMLEALAMGVPVIAYNVGDVSSAISQNRNGVLIPPGDRMAFSQELRALLDDLPRVSVMKVNCRTAITERRLTHHFMQEAYGRTLEAALATAILESSS